MRSSITVLFLFILASCETNSNHDEARKYFREATQYEGQYNLTTAIYYFTKAIHADSNYVDAYINRGADKSALNDYAGAIQDYDRALMKEPNNTLALVNRGKNKHRLKDFTGAIKDYDMAISIRQTGTASVTESDGDFPIEEVKLERGVSLYFAGNLKASFDDIQFCIDRNVLMKISLYWRGLIYTSLNKNDLACKDFHDAAALGNKDALKEMKRLCGDYSIKN